ncbi:MAG: hypothetical protein ACFFAS_11370 [Promethearchaeota archaeon]
MIQEILILNQSGIALFHHSFSGQSQFDIQLIASYFDLICRYTKKKMHASLKSFTLEKHIIFFYSFSPGLHLVFICNNMELNMDILELLADLIMENFIVMFKDNLNKFNGEISVFRSFSHVVENIINIKTFRIHKNKYIEQ